MTLRLIKPETPIATLRAIAASGARGSVAARQELVRRQCERLRQELGR